MAKKIDKKVRKQQIIENLTRSIELGGNSQTIEKLKETLESIQNDTFVSQYKKRAKRKPTKKRIRTMSKEALEFYHWMMNNDTPENADKYSHLSDEDMYNEFLKQKNSTKGNDIPHSDIRRMESEGVYEEKFQRNSSNDTTIYFQDEWNESPLHHDIDGYEESKYDVSIDRHEPFENDDETTYVDGVDERPIKKETDYSDDEFDY